MHESMPVSEACPVHVPPARRARERGMLAVVLLTATMMVVEIVVGYLAHSMALLANGWHMATHVGALGLASVAYALSRRYASHRAFALGTGKLDALAGYTNALVLGIVALVMIAESVQRLLHPSRIDFVTSLPVAVVGLAVNLLSVRLLEHGHDDDPEGTGSIMATDPTTTTAPHSSVLQVEHVDAGDLGIRNDQTSAPRTGMRALLHDDLAAVRGASCCRKHSQQPCASALH